MKNINLKNNIKLCIKTNKNTPRVAATLNFSINKPEKCAGEYLLISRLLLQGTDKYSAEEIAALLDENAIELYTEMGYDYLTFKFLALNEDLDLAFSMLSDIIKNSTFENFEKEKSKLKGELSAELDSAKMKVLDLFKKSIYKNHFYGNSYTVILDEIDKLSFEDIISDYKYILNNSEKVMSVVADSSVDEILQKAEFYLEGIEGKISLNDEIKLPEIPEKTYAELIKKDSNQAQIIQGWIVPTINTDDYVKLKLLNVILGASGLSSRLFVELREKKGLAYTVRTSYEIHKKAAVFNIYMGTEPSNVETSIEGFKTEIDKIKNELIPDVELENAKNNLIGRQQFVTETNMQQSSLYAYYGIQNLPFNYQESMINSIKQVTAQELMDCAKRCFTDNSVIAVIRP